MNISASKSLVYTGGEKHENHFIHRQENNHSTLELFRQTCTDEQNYCRRGRRKKLDFVNYIDDIWKYAIENSDECLKTATKPSRKA